MPKKYKRSNSKRRTRSRRRSMKRMRKSSIQPTMQTRYFKEKLSQVIPIYGTDATIALGIAYQQLGSLTATIYGFNNSSRWANLYKLYEEYSITGMKVKWIPGYNCPTQDSATPQAAFFQGPMFVFDDIDTYNTLGYTELQILQKDGNKIMSPQRSWKIYRSFKKLSQSNNYAWQDCAAYSSTTSNTLSNGTLGIHFKQRMSITNTPIGYFKVTHYVTFRGTAASGN